MKLTRFIKKVVLDIQIIFLLSAGITATAHAYPSYEIALPNGEYIETTEDLKVKAIGGFITAKRVWTNSRWYLNPEWADLKFHYDDLDNSVKAIDRGGAIYEKSGEAWFLEKNYHIRKDGEGYRWGRQDGAWTTYDGQGRITATGDRNTTHATFEYNGQGQRARIKDVKGNLALQFTYNAEGLLHTVEDRTGRKVQYTYTGDKLTTVTDVMGNDWTYTYDSQGQLQTRTDPEGNKIQLFYVDPNPAGTLEGTGFKAGQLKKKSLSAVSYTGKAQRDVKGAKVGTYTDAEGNVTTYQYQYNRNSRQYSATRISPEGLRNIDVYDKDGKALSNQTGDLKISQVTREGNNVEAIKDARGNITRIQYDGNRNILKTTYPDGSNTQTTWNSYNQPLTKTDELGVVTEYQYDAKGNLAKKIEAKGYPEQRVTEYQYDGYGRETSLTVKGETIAEDISSVAVYDDYGNISAYTNAEGQKTEYTHDVTGNPLTTKDPLGNITEYQYDRTGKQIKTIQAKGTPEERSKTIAYNKVGWAVQFTDARINTVRTVYDKNGRKKEITDAMGSVSRTEYDKDGKALKVTDRDGASKTYAYDTEGRVISVKDLAGDETKYVYGAVGSGLEGLLVAVKYPTYREEYKYNNRNWRVQSIQVLDEQTRLTSQTEYDAAGRAIKKTDPQQRTVQYSYNALGGTTATTDPLGGITRYQYDRFGGKQTITDAKGSVTHYKHDKQGRTVKQTLPTDGVTTYGYDANSNLIEEKSASGRKRVYFYDALNQKTKESHYLPEQNTPEREITYAYDPNGNLISYTDRQDQMVTNATYAYDAVNRKISQTVNYGAFSKTHAFSYTADGKLLERTDPDGAKEKYVWSDKGQLEQILLNGNTAIQFSDYRWGSPQTTSWSNGLKQETQYDPLMRIQTQQLKKEAEIKLRRQYQYSEAGDIAQIEREGLPLMAMMSWVV